VELFTSEGCSTCPPADEFLAQLESKQPLGHVAVIALEEHVDYWDQQGWRDPFSSPTWTSRQLEYANALHSGTPYTPEMVVDGMFGFVGNREAVARQAIAKAASGAKAKVELSVESQVPGKSATFRVAVTKIPESSPKTAAEVVLGITESGLHSSVKAGENSGHELYHSAVLRELKVISNLGKEGQETFTAQPTVKLDSKWSTQNLRGVVFVQEKKSKHILGAGEVQLAPAS
jgi:hypothetical protein